MVDWPHMYRCDTVTPPERCSLQLGVTWGGDHIWLISVECDL